MTRLDEIKRDCANMSNDVNYMLWMYNRKDGEATYLRERIAKLERPCSYAVQYYDGIQWLMLDDIGDEGVALDKMWEYYSDRENEFEHRVIRRITTYEVIAETP